MIDLQSRLRRRSKSTLCGCVALLLGILCTSGAAAVTDTELNQERETLRVYEQRIPSLLTAMRSLDRQLAALQQQRAGVEDDLSELTRTYLTKQRAFEQAQSTAATRGDASAKAAAEHSKFQYYLVERKLTNLQNKAEQLDKDIAPLKQSLQDRQLQLQQSEKKIADQKKYVRELASVTPVVPELPERIEIKSRNKPATSAQSAAVRKPMVLPADAALAATSESADQGTTATRITKSPATEAERRYASEQAKRLQALLVDAKSGKASGVRAQTLEVQHKDKSGVKHLYDLAYIGENHYTTNGKVHAGKQVFKVAKQRWITNIPAHDDGANYVFVLNATPHRRLELIMYNAELAEQKPQKLKKTSLSKK